MRYRIPTMKRREFLTAVAAIGLTARGVARAAPAWQAGVATIDITPESSLWMAGFARRTQPSQGVAMPLHAKALALKCGAQPTAVLVTVDLLGLTARITGPGRVARSAPSPNPPRGPPLQREPHALRSRRRRTVVGRVRLVAGAVGRHSRLHGAARRQARRRHREAPSPGCVRRGCAYARDEAGFAANRRVKFTPAGSGRSLRAGAAG